MGTTIMFSSLGYMILMLWICKKSLFSTIFLIIKVHLWNETNIDTHNNLHSFFYGHYNYVLFIGIHDIDALDLQEKLFFYHFPYNQSSSVKWDKLDARNNLYFFIMGTKILFSTLGYTILMHCISRKSFSFHLFPYNQSPSMKWDKLGCS